MTPTIPAHTPHTPVDTYAHATFFVDVQQRDASGAVVKTFDGVNDKVAYVDNNTVIVYFATGVENGATVYGPETSFDISILPNGQSLAEIDVDGDKKRDAFAFGHTAGKVFLMADTSMTMAEVATKRGIDLSQKPQKVVVDINRDGISDDAIPVQGSSRDTALETACQEQHRYFVMRNGDYISPEGHATVYIAQYWTE